MGNEMSSEDLLKYSPIFPSPGSYGGRVLIQKNCITIYTSTKVFCISYNPMSLVSEIKNIVQLKLGQNIKLYYNGEKLKGSMTLSEAGISESNMIKAISSSPLPKSLKSTEFSDNKISELSPDLSKYAVPDVGNIQKMRS